MSFNIHTDRYPDTMHKKIQTGSSIINAFSEALNLAHILKIRVFTLLYEQALRPGRLLVGRRKGHTVLHELTPYCLRFASLVLAVNLKALQWTFMANDYIGSSIGSP